MQANGENDNPANREIPYSLPENIPGGWVEIVQNETRVVARAPPV
jgi:hypothetical protein